MVRVVSALFLSLMLGLTSHSAAAANGAPMAVDQMVICTGFGATVIYTDADGQPTTAPHLCPDCVVHIDAGLLPAFGVGPVAIDVAVRRLFPLADAVVGTRQVWTHPARAPPVVI